MNIIATSKEEILQTCRELIRQQKGTTLNVRQVASACGVSVGTVYNYFDSKADLVGAAVESVWNDIFRCEEQDDSFSDILSCIRWMFARMEYGSRQYPGFFVLTLDRVLLSKEKAMENNVCRKHGSICARCYARYCATMPTYVRVLLMTVLRLK